MVHPPAGYDLPLPPARAVIVSSFWPDAAAWTERGYDVLPEFPRDATHAVVVLPRSKSLARGLVAMATVVPGALVIDGQKTDGVDSLWKDLRRRVAKINTLTWDHGRLMSMTAAELDARDWALAPPQPGPDGFFTQPGVFSEAKVDAGSALLAGALPAKLPARVADLGAGWGYLSRAILAREGVEHLDLVEAEARALECARLNITDPRASFHWADARTFRPAEAVQAVVMNPPFHESRAGDPDLGRAFIAAARRILTPNGRLWCVANRHLPYETKLREAFRDVEEVPGSPAFKLFAASRPRAPDRIA